MAAGSETARSEAQTTEALPEAKGRELVGLMLATLAILLVAALLSYDPADPSLLREVADPAARPNNWIGRLGAHVAAASFALLGWVALVVPLVVWIPAWRALRRLPQRDVLGRGFGAALLLVALPLLLQLALGERLWRGAPFDAGGLLGRLESAALIAALNRTGAFVVALALVTAGVSLVVQSTLGELLERWQGRAGELWGRVVVWWSRSRQKAEKERQRQRVVDKHRRQRIEDREAALTSTPAAPLRVVEKPGRGSFAVRRVHGAPSGPFFDEDEPIGEVPTPSRPPARQASGRPLPAAIVPDQPRLFEGNAAVQLPPVNLLRLEADQRAVDEHELIRLGEVIRASCAQFGVEGTVEAISPGPVITVFEYQPAPGVKVSQIVNLQDDLALALKAESIRIDRLPGRSTLGIELPNAKRSIIRLGALIEKETFRRSPSPLTMALGTDIHGEAYYADLATMPHLLVAGATGSGKSVGLQTMITSMLYKATREEVQFIFIDPKRVELSVYSDIPHLKTEVVVEPKKAANALRWAVAEMERRYRLLAEVHVRSIDYYNRAVRDPEVQQRLRLKEDDASGISLDDLKPLPYYVVIIDELADLMMVAAAEVEASIARLAQMARAVGIHLIVATQRPSVDVLTGTIKANFPCRMAFATASRHDSRTILDQVGSERLLGKGDMLFMPPGTSRVMRLHGAYVSEEETAALVRWLRRQGQPELDPSVLEFAGAAERAAAGDGGDGDDDLFDEAARLVVKERKASASFLQRRMRIGFSRASRLIDLMERDGLLGPSQGSKSRDVLVPPDYFDEVDETER
jgi:S-DNA-T family DNA segregation ATPase FtsK/SpoIIIE